MRGVYILREIEKTKKKLKEKKEVGWIHKNGPTFHAFTNIKDFRSGPSSAEQIRQTQIPDRISLDKQKQGHLLCPNLDPTHSCLVFSSRTNLDNQLRQQFNSPAS